MTKNKSKNVKSEPKIVVPKIDNTRTVRIEDLQKNQVFIATPMYGGKCEGLYMKSCLDLQAKFASLGIRSQFTFLFNESLITRARNYLVDVFLRSDCTHLLFIDSDIDFVPDDIITLLAIDKDVIGAPYPKKSINWNAIFECVKNMPEEERKTYNPASLAQLAGDYVFNPVPGTTKFSVAEPLEVMEIGTGMMLVKREVFDKFREEYPHLKYRPDHAGQKDFDGSRMIHAYFDTVIDPQSQRYLSEDYMFCQYWREIGGHIFLCPWMKTKHIGTFAYEGDLPEIANRVGRFVR